jgi:hypothetical protein
LDSPFRHSYYSQQNHWTLPSSSPMCPSSTHLWY